MKQALSALLVGTDTRAELILRLGIDQRLLYPLYIVTTVTHHMHLSIITGISRTREKPRLLFYINHLLMNGMIPIFYTP